MTIALVAHTIVGPSFSNATTSAINTTGANLIVIGIGIYHGDGTFPTISDNQGNTYTPLTAYDAGHIARVQQYYCLNPTTNASHTFTITGGLVVGSMAVAAFSGIATSSAFDVQNGNAPGVTGASSVTTGSITPSANGELVTSAFCVTDGASGTISVTAELSITDFAYQAGGLGEGVAFGWVVQSTAAAINPTWTVASAGTQDLAASIASFKAGAAGPAFIAPRPRIISQAVNRASTY